MLRSRRPWIGRSILGFVAIFISVGGGTAFALSEPPAPTLTKVTVRADGPTHRLVTVVADGPPLTDVEVCDLTTSRCVGARLESGAWVARLRAKHPTRRYAIGVIGQSPAGYVWGHYGSRPVPPPVNTG
jgi:hypothetical protein